MSEKKRGRKQRVYTDELSREVFDLFDQKLYPSDVSNLIGGSKKDYEHMYHYWMGQKREFIEEGLVVDFVLNIKGYPEHIVGGQIVKVYNNSVMVSINDFDPADKSGVNELNGRAVIRQDEAKIIKAVPREDNDADDADESKDTKKKPAKRKKTTKKADKKD